MRRFSIPVSIICAALLCTACASTASYTQQSAPVTAPTAVERAGPSSFYTVIAACYSSSANGKASATEDAAKLSGTVSQADVLLSDEYSSLRPGYWVVYAGQFATLDQAKSVLTAVRAAGYRSAYTRLVVRADDVPIAVISAPSVPTPAPPAPVYTPQTTDPNYYSSPPPGANPSPEWTGQNTQWHQVQGYTRSNGTYVAPHYRRTK